MVRVDRISNPMLSSHGTRSRPTSGSPPRARQLSITADTNASNSASRGSSFQLSYANILNGDRAAGIDRGDGALQRATRIRHKGKNPAKPRAISPQAPQRGARESCCITLTLSTPRARHWAAKMIEKAPRLVDCHDATVGANDVGQVERGKPGPAPDVENRMAGAETRHTPRRGGIGAPTACCKRSRSISASPVPST